MERRRIFCCCWRMVLFRIPSRSAVLFYASAFHQVAVRSVCASLLCNKTVKWSVCVDHNSKICFGIIRLLFWPLIFFHAEIIGMLKIRNRGDSYRETGDLLSCLTKISVGWFIGICPPLEEQQSLFPLVFPTIILFRIHILYEYRINHPAEVPLPTCIRTWISRDMKPNRIFFLPPRPSIWVSLTSPGAPWARLRRVEACPSSWVVQPNNPQQLYQHRPTGHA